MDRIVVHESIQSLYDDQDEYQQEGYSQYQQGSRYPISSPSGYQPQVQQQSYHPQSGNTMQYHVSPSQSYANQGNQTNNKFQRGIPGPSGSRNLGFEFENEGNFVDTVGQQQPMRQSSQFQQQQQHMGYQQHNQGNPYQNYSGFQNVQGSQGMQQMPQTGFGKVGQKKRSTGNRNQGFGNQMNQMNQMSYEYGMESSIDEFGGPSTSNSQSEDEIARLKQAIQAKEILLRERNKRIQMLESRLFTVTNEKDKEIARLQGALEAAMGVSQSTALHSTPSVSKSTPKSAQKTKPNKSLGLGSPSSSTSKKTPKKTQGNRKSKLKPVNGWLDGADQHVSQSQTRPETRDSVSSYAQAHGKRSNKKSQMRTAWSADSKKQSNQSEGTIIFMDDGIDGDGLNGGSGVDISDQSLVDSAASSVTNTPNKFRVTKKGEKLRKSTSTKRKGSRSVGRSGVKTSSSNSGLSSSSPLKKSHNNMVGRSATGSMVAPSWWDAKQAADRTLDADLELEFVHGYRGFDGRNNLFLNRMGHLVYHAAQVGVIYDPEANQQQFFSDHFDDVTCLAYHPLQDIAATGQKGAKPYVCIWDASSGVVKATLSGKHRTGISAVAFSDDGQFVASVGSDTENTLVLWDWEKEEVIASVKSSTDRVYAVGFDPTDNTIVTCGKKHVKFWTLEEHKHDGSVMLRARKGVFGKVGSIQHLLCMAFPEDHSNISLDSSGNGQHTGSVYTGTSNGNIYKWEGYNLVDSVDKRYQALLDGPVYSLTTNADGLISGGKGGKVVFWNYLLRPIKVIDLQFLLSNSPQSNIYVDSHDQKSESQVCIRAIAQNQERLVVGTRNNEIVEIDQRTGDANILVQGHASGELWGIAAHEEFGLFASVGDDKTVRVWHTSFRQSMRVANLASGGRCVAFSPEGDVVAVGTDSGTIYILESELLQQVYRFKHREKRISVVRYSPNGTMLAVGSHDNVIDLYDVTQSYQWIGMLKGHSSHITHIDWSDDSAFIQSNCGSRELLYFDTMTLKQVPSSSMMKDVIWHTFTCIIGWPVQGVWPKGADGTDINAVSRSWDGELVAAADDFGMVSLMPYPFPMRYKDQVQRYRGHSSHVTNVIFTRDNSRVISAGGNDKCVFQWRVNGPNSKEQDNLDMQEREIEEQVRRMTQQQQQREMMQRNINDISQQSRFDPHGFDQRFQQQESEVLSRSQIAGFYGYSDDFVNQDQQQQQHQQQQQSRESNDRMQANLYASQMASRERWMDSSFDSTMGSEYTRSSWEFNPGPHQNPMYPDNRNRRSMKIVSPIRQSQARRERQQQQQQQSQEQLPTTLTELNEQMARLELQKRELELKENGSPQKQQSNGHRYEQDDGDSSGSDVEAAKALDEFEKLEAEVLQEEGQQQQQPKEEANEQEKPSSPSPPPPAMPAVPMIMVEDDNGDQVSEEDFVIQGGEQKKANEELDVDEQELVEPVIKIQAVFRGRQARKEVEELKEQQEMEASAIKIQSHFRGLQARKEVEEMKEEQELVEPVTKIQAVFRGRQARKEVEEMKEEQEQQEMEASALKIQAHFRGLQARKEVQEMKREEKAEAEPEAEQDTEQEDAKKKKKRKKKKKKTAEDEEEQEEDGESRPSSSESEADGKKKKKRKKKKKKEEDSEQADQEKQQEQQEEEDEQSRPSSSESEAEAKKKKKKRRKKKKKEEEGHDADMDQDEYRPSPSETDDGGEPPADEKKKKKKKRKKKKKEEEEEVV